MYGSFRTIPTIYLHNLNLIWERFAYNIIRKSLIFIELAKCGI